MRAKLVSLLFALCTLFVLAMAPSGCAGCDEDEKSKCSEQHTSCVNACDPLSGYDPCVNACGDDLCTCLDDNGCDCDDTGV